MKRFFLVLLLVWGILVGVVSVLDPVWEKTTGEMIGAAAIVVLALWAATQLWAGFRGSDQPES